MKPEPNISWSLVDNDMGVLERAGLAGLYLSLTAATEAAGRSAAAKNLAQTLEWRLSDTGVELFWEKGTDRKALSELISWAWQVKDGVFFLPGVHRTQDELEHAWMRLNTHTGLLQTFFQHNRVLPKSAPEGEVISFDEGVAVRISYRKIPNEAGKKSKSSGLVKRHQVVLPQIKAVSSTDRGALLTDGLESAGLIGLQSWIYPGAARRFGKEGESGWQGLRLTALILMFAPIACAYVELPSNIKRTKDKKETRTSNWAFVVPNINNLCAFEKGFIQVLNTDTKRRIADAYAAGVADAVLRYATVFIARDMKRHVGSQNINAVAMGNVSHYERQQVRKSVQQFKPSDISIARYSKVSSIFDSSLTKFGKLNDDGATHWIKRPRLRGRIADNLMRSRPWYRELLVPPDWQLDDLDKDRKRENEKRKQRGESGISIAHFWFETISRYEWSKLMELVNEDVWDNPDERSFLKLLHEALRRLLDKEQKALDRGGTRTLHERWEHRIEEVRRALMRAKTLPLTREVFSNLLAESGGSKLLFEERAMVWRLINGRHQWKQARDLGFLALVTFVDSRLGKATNAANENTKSEGDAQ